MAKYTFDVRELVSTFGREEVKGWFEDYELSDYLTEAEIDVINERGVWSKDQLAERIVTHFYLREIGQDSIGSFILMVNRYLDYFQFGAIATLGSNYIRLLL